MKSINFVLVVFVLSFVSGLHAQWRRATAEELGNSASRLIARYAGETAAPSVARVVAGRMAEPYRAAMRGTDHQVAARNAAVQNGQETTRRPAPNTTSTAPRTRSRMTADDLERQYARVKDLTSITVGNPMAFEQANGYYNGFGGFYGMNLPGSIYPQYSSLQPAKSLPAYIQQELFEEFQRSGEFNPLLPATGQMGGQLDVLTVEAKVGKGVMRTGQDGKPIRVRIGPDTWSSTNYAAVSSIGILDETVQGFQLRGEDIARVTDSIPGIGGRGRRIIWDTVGRSQKSAVDRQIVGILYVAIVDLETRSVLKSSTGVAAMSYTEFASMDLPAIRMQSVRYAGAGKLARELVLSALYDETDRDRSVEKFLQRRGVNPNTLPGRGPSARRR